MKKHILVTLFTTLLLVTSCDSGHLDRKEDEAPKEDEPQMVEGRKASEIEGNELKLLPKYVVNKLSSFESYKSVTKGSTIATVLFIKTTQPIDAETIKGKEYSYYRNESRSDIVSTAHLAYYHNDEAVYKINGEETYHTLPLEEYLNIYGTYPFENSLEGYSISYDAIKEVKRVESDVDYKFQVTFDVYKSTNNVRIQMKVSGGLDDYPSFSGIKMTITVKEDFTPVTLYLEAAYTAKKIVESSCNQYYTVTYSNYNEDIEIENLEEAKEHFTK